MSSPTGTLSSQEDLLFKRLLSTLLEELRFPLESLGLNDAGILRCYPRSPWHELEHLHLAVLQQGERKRLMCKCKNTESEHVIYNNLGSTVLLGRRSCRLLVFLVFPTRIVNILSCGLASGGDALEVETFVVGSFLLVRATSCPSSSSDSPFVFGGCGTILTDADMSNNTTFRCVFEEFRGATMTPHFQKPASRRVRNFFIDWHCQSRIRLFIMMEV